ncbi:PhzF family phenazine biosynthesis protein [Streptomyces sp. AM6-12]|uniref:PhzF family phenazine biosynthesis protein n=1 Tax=Streptomyces sp. AM6-12 TaxID=3345149 RepID=UPI0037B7ADEB
MRTATGHEATSGLDGQPESDPLGANPAGAVLDAGRDEATMAAPAAEVGYSETAFAVARPGGSLDIRYFSPQAEDPSCGHATIATAVAHASRHGVGRLLLHTRAGPVPVTTATAPDGSVTATLVSAEPAPDSGPLRRRPRRTPLDALMVRRGWTTIALVHRESDTVLHARNPFPPGGVVEDPATGAAAAALGGYLRANGLVTPPADPASGIEVTGTAVPLP